MKAARPQRDDIASDLDSLTTGAAQSRAPAESVHDTLEAILDHVRRLFDVSGCAFLIVDWDRRHIRPEAAWFASREVGDALRLVLDRPYEPERPGLTEAAIEQGEPLVMREIESWPAAARLRERIEERLEPDAARVAWDWYRSSCFVACPMRTEGGRLLGVLAIALAADRRIGPEDLRTVDILAGLAALALERAELLDREALRAHEELLLNQAAREMALSLEPDQVYESVVRGAARLTGADKVMLTRFEPASQDLRAVATLGFSERVQRSTFPVDEGMIGVVARTGRPYVSREEDASRFLRWVVEGERLGSFAHLPITLGPRLFGVLTVGREDPEAIGAEAIRRLEALAPLAAGAIANALDFQHERRIAQALARGFVPGAPQRLADVETGLVYEPAEHTGGGGDFFGLWVLRSGATAVLVGDVSGKGLEVSATSAMARFVVEARTWDSEQPSEVLAQVNALLSERVPEIGFVPTFLAVIGKGRLRYSNAGHLPPLLVAAGGEVRELGVAGLPLAVDAEANWVETELPFGTGDLVFAATDGLVEARRDGDQFGEGRLRALVTEHASRLSPQELVDLAHQHVADWATRITDDIVILAVRAK